MLTRRKAILTLGVATVIKAQAQRSSKFAEDGTPNGRWWVTSSRDCQVVFVAGARAALGAVTSLMGNADPRSAQLLEYARMYAVESSSNGEIASKVTWLYSDSANASIDVMSMMRIAASIFRGTTAAEVERELEILRSVYAK